MKHQLIDMDEDIHLRTHRNVGDKCQEMKPCILPGAWLALPHPGQRQSLAESTVAGRLCREGVTIPDAGKCYFRKSSQNESTFLLPVAVIHGFPYKVFNGKDKDDLFIFLFLVFVKGSTLASSDMIHSGLNLGSCQSDIFSGKINFANFDG